jgi:histidine triad (HIT) family protein
VSDCVFCELIAGRGESSVVYEDETLVALMDLHPVNPGHVLLIPRRHAAAMADLDEETGAHAFRVAMRMQQAVRRSGVRCEGVNLFVADGEAAFQDVFHFHLHVIPRFQGDPFKISADWKEAPRSELDRVATDIHTSYERLWT